MKRVFIIGGSGSGKTTLARKIGHLRGISVHHIDTLAFYDNWKLRSKTEIFEGVNQIISGDQWIFEGNYCPEFPGQALKADTLIFLDIATPIRLWRVIARSLRNYGKSLPEHPENCKMTIRWWLISVVINYRKQGRPKALKLLVAARNTVRCYHIKSNNDLKRLYMEVAGLGASGQ